MNKDSFFIIFLAVSLAVHGVALAFIKPIKPIRYTEPKEIEIMPFELPDDPEPPARVKENKPVFEEKKAPPPPPEEQRVETPRIAPEPLKPEKQEPPKDDRKTEPDKQPAEPPRGVEGAFPEKIKMSSAADNGSSADNV